MPAIIAATGGLGCAASQGSNVAKVAVFTTDVLAGANAVRGVVEVGKEIVKEKKITARQAISLSLDVLTLAVVKTKACFTEDTQIVVGVIYPEGTHYRFRLESTAFQSING